MLQVEYSTQDAFRAEYASNIARGGIFIATEAEHEVRSIVDVELALTFCNEYLVLEGEVVHRITPEMAAAGATPGVAIQFLMPVRELRERLGDHAGDAGSPDERVRKTGRRAAPRSRARLKAVVAKRDDTRISGQTRDVSATGLLLEVSGDPIPVGDPVHLTLDHPVTGEKMPIEGRVVRHVKSSRGVVTAMGVELAHAAARHTEVASFMQDVQASEHSRRLGAINGPIGDVGISDLLQMFSTTMPRGTLMVTDDEVEGTIGFESGSLLWAEFDGLHGQPALETMLALRAGHFEIEPRLVEPLAGQDEPRSLEQSILSALCALDESRHEAELTRQEAAPRPQASERKAPSKRAGSPAHPPAPDRVPASATFRIDADALAEHRAGLDQTELAVLDLAQVGLSVEKMIEVIPEPEIGVMMAIDSLVARGVLELA
jgi:Tfp pilus assembly protein PilZ